MMCVLYELKEADRIYLETKYKAVGLKEQYA